MRGAGGRDPVKKALGRGLAAAFAALLLFVVPVPCVLYEPGKVVPVDDLVAIGEAGPGEEAAAGERESSRASDRQGEWLLTTVYLEPRVTLWSVIASAWREDREVHAKRAVFGESGAKSYKARMDVLMAESQGMATEAAFRLAGVRYEAKPAGVYVARGAGSLEAGDRIAAVDGVATDGLGDLRKALRARAGREAELIVLRQGREIAVRMAVDPNDADGSAADRTNADRLTTIQIETDEPAADRTETDGTSTSRTDVRPATNQAGGGAEAPRERLGGAELIEVRDIRPEHPAHSVTIDAGEFAGPSAGLALALHIYERLAGESLTGGRRVAATGTIGPAGAVGAVGGVRMKAIAAARAGADLFLVPEANAAEAAAAAKAEGGGMEVAGVDSLEEAVALLRSRTLTKAAR